MRRYDILDTMFQYNVHINTISNLFIIFFSLDIIEIMLTANSMERFYHDLAEGFVIFFFSKLSIRIHVLCIQ